MFIKKVFSSFLVFSLLCNIVIAEETKTEPKKESTNAFMRFIDKYVLPEKNPIFQNQEHTFLISYNIATNKGNKRIDGVGGGAFARAVHSVQLHYAQPDKFFKKVHGRLSVGVYTLYGVKGVYKNIFKAIGVELIQELAFGTPTLYITAGIGPSFAYGKLGETNKKNSTDGLTGFNFSSVIKIGHRFDCGAIIEIAFHHYSNGNIDEKNQGLDMIGASFGYVF